MAQVSSPGQFAAGRCFRSWYRAGTLIEVLHRSRKRSSIRSVNFAVMLMHGAWPSNINVD